MKGLLLVLLLFKLFASQKCGSQVVGEMPYCWLNTKYTECLKNKLPCECEKITETYYSLAIDTNSSSKNFGVALSKYNLMEPNIFSIKKIGLYEYEVISNERNATTWAKLLIKKDSIYLIENATQSVFYKTNNSNKYNTQHYLFDNVDLLNKSLAKRGYPRIEEIVKDDSLICECNKWKGNINLLSVEGKPQSWILELKNDSLFINTVTYPNEDPDPDDPIIPKKFKTYKWQ